MSNNQLFEWVTINSESDLPGEGTYTVKLKNGGYADVKYQNGDKSVWHLVTAYLRPIEPVIAGPDKITEDDLYNEIESIVARANPDAQWASDAIFYIATEYASQFQLYKIPQTAIPVKEKVSAVPAKMPIMDVLQFSSSMAEQYMRHDYRSMWDIWLMVAKLAEDCAKGMLIPPNWYKKDEIHSWLINQNYSVEIADELSLKWANDLQSSFAKGWEKGYNDNTAGTFDYKYFSEVYSIPDINSAFNYGYDCGYKNACDDTCSGLCRKEEDQINAKKEYLSSNAASQLPTIQGQASTPAEIVAFAEWVRAHYEKNDNGDWVYNDGEVFTTSELYTIYTEYLKQKAK